MKVVKFLIASFVTLALIYVIDRGWGIGGSPIPPLGKFFDPYQGFWQNIESKNQRFEHEISIQGLSAPVKVVFDSLMIPHIFASNDEDLYIAQGYVTAMHRLWQMEFQTHAAAGRVSEILGNDLTLNYDRTQRRQGMVFGARKALEYINENSNLKKIVDGYTSGINQYIGSLKYKNLPFEYKLLDYEPEQWTPLKCGLLLKSMSEKLNKGDKDMEMTNALTLFGKEYVELLYPDDEGVSDPIVDKPGAWNFKPITLDSIPLAVPESYLPPPAKPIRIRKKPAEDPTTGSNNWAVSGSKTATGSPLLCNDPHLQLNLPSLWYVLQLQSPTVNVMGASLPGVPFVIIGHNDSIAWGVTNAQRDLVDWYKITYQNDSKQKYLLDGQWIPTEKVVEEFKVKGREIFVDTVVYTKWGPVMYDKNFHAENDLNDYAFRWIAHDRSEEFMALYKLNRAKNHDDYMDALDHFHSPGQNFAFASVSGDIAMRVQGKFPVRRANEGRFVLDGSKSSQGWQAFIPNDQLIMNKNPARGFVSSANQFPVDKTYPYYVTADHFEAYRNRRINQLLSQKNNLTVSDMMRIQNDNFNLKASESLPFFLSQLDSATLTKPELAARKILKSWNFMNDVNAQGASYYEAWWNALMPMTWDEMSDDRVLLERPTTYQTIKLLKEQPDFKFFDVRETSETENARDVIRASFKYAVQKIEEWKKVHGDTVAWGVYKDGYIGHILPPMKALSVPVIAGGNKDIVNAHSRTHGPSWRMIVSLEKSGVKAWGVYPGGQSGNPGSRYYSNMIPVWSHGQYYQLQFLKDAEVKENSSTMLTTLNPK